MFPNKLHWEYFRWVISSSTPCSTAEVAPWLSFPCPSALVGHCRTLLLMSSGSTEDVRDPLCLQHGCGHHPWHPRIPWPRLKHTQELSKPFSYHLKKAKCWQCNKNSHYFFFQLSHPSACLDSGLGFFPPLGSRWHSASFLSVLWFQCITFQTRRFILERSWLCWKSDLRIPEHEAPRQCCFFLPALPWEVYFPSFPRALALGTYWDVFYLLRDTELESSIIQALHGFQTVLSLSQNSELINAFPNS